MRVGILLFAVTLALGMNAGHGQQPPDPAIPEACRVQSSEALPDLEKRRQSLEREIAANGKPPTGSDALRKNQQELLRVLFEIECLNTRRKLQPVEIQFRKALPKPAGAPKIDSSIEVTTYYATNRNPTGSSEPLSVYGSKFETTLHYGRAVVTIPLTHTPGSIELPILWKLQRESDPNRHFVLKSVVPLNTDAARKELAEKLDSLGERALLLFVHGYNTGFQEAAMRTAQLAYDLKFPGLPLFFSWPSANQILGYWQDEETAQLSEGVFEQLLEEISQLRATDVYIVAHSMGSRIVGHALKTRADKGKESKHLREVLLAAPDINADLFRTVIAPKLTGMQGTRITVYASSSDLALKASKAVHGFRRLGETTGGVFTYAGVDTIDASTASPATRAYGHSYLMDSLSVLKDIQSIIRQKFSAKQRGLSEVGRSPDTSWRLQ